MIRGDQDAPSAEPADLDLAVLAAQSGGDRELERDLLVLFRQQCDRLLPELRAGCNREARADAAHTLRGGAAAIGAERVRALTGALEEMLRGPADPAGEAALATALAAAGAAVGRAIAARLGET